MRLGYSIFCLFIAGAWVLLLVLTLRAWSTDGLALLGGLLVGDLRQPWRLQLNADFAVHVLLVAGWMVYRAGSWRTGLLNAAGALLLGGLFTCAYLLVETRRARGDMNRLMLGANLPE